MHGWKEFSKILWQKKKTKQKVSQAALFELDLREKQTNSWPTCTAMSVEWMTHYLEKIKNGDAALVFEFVKIYEEKNWTTRVHLFPYISRKKIIYRNFVFCALFHEMGNVIASTGFHSKSPIFAKCTKHERNVYFYHKYFTSSILLMKENVFGFDKQWNPMQIILDKIGIDVTVRSSHTTQ